MAGIHGLSVLLLHVAVSQTRGGEPRIKWRAFWQLDSEKYQKLLNNDLGLRLSDERHLRVLTTSLEREQGSGLVLHRGNLYPFPSLLSAENFGLYCLVNRHQTALPRAVFDILNFLGRVALFV